MGALHPRVQKKIVFLLTTLPIININKRQSLCVCQGVYVRITKLIVTNEVILEPSWKYEVSNVYLIKIRQFLIKLEPKNYIYLSYPSWEHRKICKTLTRKSAKPFVQKACKKIRNWFCFLSLYSISSLLIFPQVFFLISLIFILMIY